MGSLPNLHELDKPHSNPSHPISHTSSFHHYTHQRVGPVCSNPPYYNFYQHQQQIMGGAGPSSGQGTGPSLTQEERNRILHRHSSRFGGVKLRHNIGTQGGSVKEGYYDYVYQMGHPHHAYSPILPSSHQLFNRPSSSTPGALMNSTRQSPHSLLQRSQSRGAARRDSANSSIGANSVRRLIAVVRGAHGRLGPIYSRRVLMKNLATLCCTHALSMGALLPFLALQSSMSIWIQQPPLHSTISSNASQTISSTISPLSTQHFLPSPSQTTSLSINVGSYLLVLLHLVAAATCPAAPYLNRKLRPNYLLALSYFLLSAFFAAHLYPHLGVLFVVYAIAGVMLGPASVCRLECLMTISVKITQIFGDDEDDAKHRRRAIIVRRVARAFQAAHDFGLILGSLLSALIITYSITWYYQSNGYGLNASVNSNATGEVDIGIKNCKSINSCVNHQGTMKPLNTSVTYEYYNTLLDEVFSVDELGDRICGAQACPVHPTPTVNSNHLPPTTRQTLAIAYSMLCTAASVLALACLDRIKSYVPQDHPLERGEGWRALGAVKDSFRDKKLQMAAPLAIFVGMEQAYMYGDFSQSYVECTLGIHHLNLVFLCMGLLQSVAACTLSMLMRTIKRYYVIAVGFAFHACLLMVQLMWKPLEDDPALFYVISAAWGVCNAVWEMLNFTLITGMYSDSWEVPFANSCCFRYLGMALSFALHAHLCTWLKLYVLGAAMLIAIVPLLWLESKLLKEQQQQQQQQQHNRRSCNSGGGSLQRNQQQAIGGRL